jgi:hypothetical protein
MTMSRYLKTALLAMTLVTGAGAMPAVALDPSASATTPKMVIAKVQNVGRAGTVAYTPRPEATRRDYREGRDGRTHRGDGGKIRVPALPRKTERDYRDPSTPRAGARQTKVQVIPKRPTLANPGGYRPRNPSAQRIEVRKVDDRRGGNRFVRVNNARGHR